MILSGKTRGSRGRHFPVPFVYHKGHTDYPGIDPGSAW
jgi:hypothetical protein